MTDRPLFETLTPIHAVRRLALEQPEDPDAITARLIDLVAPIGVGQRVLVKGPRGSGATELLVSIITAIEMNEPDIHVMGLFLDQRPEDITEGAALHPERRDGGHLVRPDRRGACPDG